MGPSGRRVSMDVSAPTRAWVSRGCEAPDWAARDCLPRDCDGGLHVLPFFGTLLASWDRVGELRTGSVGHNHGLRSGRMAEAEIDRIAHQLTVREDLEPIRPLIAQVAQAGIREIDPPDVE